MNHLFKTNSSETYYKKVVWNVYTDVIPKSSDWWIIQSSEFSPPSDGNSLEYECFRIFLMGYLFSPLWQCNGIIQMSMVWEWVSFPGKGNEIDCISNLSCLFIFKEVNRPRLNLLVRGSRFGGAPRREAVGFSWLIVIELPNQHYWDNRAVMQWLWYKLKFSFSFW